MVVMFVSLVLGVEGDVWVAGGVDGLWANAADLSSMSLETWVLLGLAMLSCLLLFVALSGIELCC